MSYKIVRNASGEVVCFGPNTDQYQPGLAAGHVLTVEASIPPKPLPEVKAAKLASFTASRDAATVTNVTAHTRQWQADERSQKLLSSAITMAMAGAPLPAAWRDVDNSNMPITVIGELVAIAGAMAVQTQAAYVKAWTLKADVDAALTAEAVSAVVW